MFYIPMREEDISLIEHRINEYAAQIYSCSDEVIKSTYKKSLWNEITKLFHASEDSILQAVIYYKNTYLEYTFICNDDLTDWLNSYSKSSDMLSFAEYLNNKILEVRDQIEESKTIRFEKYGVIQLGSIIGYNRIRAAIDYFASKFANEREDSYDEISTNEDPCHDSIDGISENNSSDWLQRYHRILAYPNAKISWIMAKFLVEECKGTIMINGELRNLNGALIFQGKKEKIPFYEGILIDNSQGKGFDDRIILDSLRGYRTAGRKFSNFLEELVKRRANDQYRGVRITSFEEPVNGNDNGNTIGETISDDTNETRNDTFLSLLDEFVEMGNFAKWLSEFENIKNVKKATKFCVFFTYDYISNLCDHIFEAQQSSLIEYIKRDIDIILSKNYREFSRRNYQICQVYIFYLKRFSDPQICIKNEGHALEIINNVRNNHLSEEQHILHFKNAIELYNDHITGRLDKNKYKDQGSLHVYFDLSNARISQLMKEYSEQKAKFRKNT